MTEENTNSEGSGTNLLDNPEEMLKVIDQTLARSRRERAYNLYKSSLRSDLAANEREILLWRAREVLLGEKDGPVAAVTNGANEEVQFSNSIDKERMDFFWVPLNYFGKRAFSTLTLTQLYNRVKEAWRQAEDQFGKFSLPPPPDGTNGNVLAQLVKALDEVAGTHYAIVATGMCFYVVLERLREKYGAFPFLKAASELSALLVQYAAHEPRNAIPLEEEGIEAVGGIHSVITTVQDYLLSEEFERLEQAIASGKITATTSSGASRPISASVFASIAKIPEAGKRVKISGGKGEKIGVVFALTVADVEIDVSEKRSPLAILDDVAVLLSRLVNEQRLALMGVRSIASGLNYNINTNAWGSVATGTEHILRMEAIRTKILKYMKIESEVLIPRIFLKQYFRLVYLRGGLLPGEVQYSDTLLPNLKVSIRTSTKQFTKQTLSDSQNFTQSADATTRDTLDTQIENEQNKRQEDTTSTNKYKNTTENFNVGGGVTGGMGMSLGGGAPAAASPGKAKSPAPMSGTQGINANFNISYGTNKAEGTSTDTNSTRENTQRVLNAAQTSILNEKKVTQSKTVAASAERVTEETAENTQTRDYQNPNRASSLRLDFVNLVRKIYACYLVMDVKIFFSNGVSGSEVDLAHLQQLLDEVLVPEELSPGVRRGLYEEVIKACRVLDYQRRVVTMLDEEENPPIIRGDNYFDLLSDAGHQLDARDYVLYQCSPYLRGVVFAVDEFLVPLDATTFVARATQTALDANEQRDFEIELRKRDADARLREKTVERAILDMDALKSMLKFIENYNPANPEEVKAKGDLYFRLIKESGHILNTVTLDGFFKQGWGPGSSGDGNGGKSPADIVRQLGIR